MEISMISMNAASATTGAISRGVLAPRAALTGGVPRRALHAGGAAVHQVSARIALIAASAPRLLSA